MDNIGSKTTIIDSTFLFSRLLYLPDSEVLVHFDGWGPEYDYWCPANSVELHPPGWCSKHDWELQTPISEPVDPSVGGRYTYNFLSLNMQPLLL